MAKQTKAFEFGPFRLDVRERRLTRDGHFVPLRGRVFDTLYTLVSRHGCLVTKDELMAAVWPDSVVEESNLNHNICILRRALGEKVTGQKYIETVPRQGYRFVAEVKELSEPDQANSSHFPDNSPNAPVIREPQQEKRSYPRGLEFPAAGEDGTGRVLSGPRALRGLHIEVMSYLSVAILLIASYFGVKHVTPDGTPSRSRVMLAVLPFENLTGDSTQDYVAEGLHHELISQLSRRSPCRVGVIARTSAMSYRGTRKSVSEIGHELRVNYVVEGSVRIDDGSYRITVILVRVQDQAHLWAANYERAGDSITALQVEIAEIISTEIHKRLQVEPDADPNRDFPSSSRMPLDGEETTTCPLAKV
jgi:TolB-like protein/DNA-binding winged helix-turn-helix (wHTH) protein